MAKQKQNRSPARTTKAAKATTKASSSNLKKHNIQHFHLKISSLDSSSSSSATNININDIIQTYLQKCHNKLRPHSEDLHFEIQNHFDRTNAHFDRVEDRLKHIDKRLDKCLVIVNGVERLEEDAKEIIASRREISENRLGEGAVGRDYQQAGPHQNRLF